MRNALVIDASIALAWVHPSQATNQTAELLTDVENGSKLVVPSLWFLETANALLVLERRKKLTKAERTKALARLAALNVTCDELGYTAVFARVSELASKHGLSVYDACYLELSTRRKLPLASLDTALLSAATREGAKLA